MHSEYETHIQLVCPICQRRTRMISFIRLIFVQSMNITTSFFNQNGFTINAISNVVHRWHTIMVSYTKYNHEQHTKQKLYQKDNKLLDYVRNSHCVFYLEKKITNDAFVHAHCKKQQCLTFNTCKSEYYDISIECAE